MFTGEYRHAVDDKGRLAVPARFRGQLADGAVVARWIDSCLAIFPMTAWNELSAKVGSLPMTDPNARLLQRQLFAGAFETELDAQGRVLVPQGLRDVRRPRDRGARPRVPRPRRDLGARPLGGVQPEPRRPRRVRPGDRRAGDLTSHHMRFQGPLGIRNRLVEERWRKGTCRSCRSRSSGRSSRHPAASRSTRRSAAVGTPSGSWRPPTPTAACSASTPTRSRSTGSAIRLARYGDRLVLRRANFRELADVAPAAGFGSVDGALFDLGLSSYQLADRDRGFGFRAGGPLDMRFDTTRGVPASELIATLDADELAALFRRYGEEPSAWKIAKAIVAARGRPRRSRRPRTWPRSSSGSRRRTRASAAASTPRRACSRRSGSRSTRSSTRCRGPGRGRRPAAARRPPRRPVLPLARGPDRQALPRVRAARLRLPARGAGLRLRPHAAPAPRDPPLDDPDRRRDRRQPARPERATARRRAARRLSAHAIDRRRGDRPGHRPTADPGRSTRSHAGPPAHGGGVP